MIVQENSGMETVESLKQRIRELEAEVVGLKEAGKRILKWWDEDCVSSTWPECGPEMEYLRHCLSTPTGSNLLAKVEAGTECAKALQVLDSLLSFKEPIPENGIVFKNYDAIWGAFSRANYALAVYRAAVEGVKE